MTERTEVATKVSVSLEDLLVVLGAAIAYAEETSDYACWRAAVRLTKEVRA